MTFTPRCNAPSRFPAFHLPLFRPASPLAPLLCSHDTRQIGGKCSSNRIPLSACIPRAIPFSFFIETCFLPNCFRTICNDSPWNFHPSCFIIRVIYRNLLTNFGIFGMFFFSFFFLGDACRLKIRSICFANFYYTWIYTVEFILSLIVLLFPLLRCTIC